MAFARRLALWRLVAADAELSLEGAGQAVDERAVGG